MSNFFAPQTSPGSQPSIKSALATKELKDAVDLVVGRFWDMLKRTGNVAFDPISLENINILADWVAKEAPLLTIEDVDGWAVMEQPAQVQESIPDFNGGDEIGGLLGEELRANKDDNHYYSDA
ncbi:hypothetical protein MRB53_023262 [Persea americana]|uniref:Uncharacterized protein n=1 Tax=Persea americana TaxID=3435 RepID=A0ACC2LA71_PERAE|nr:hypothetical protein MRB53_023262 [Persea americana]